ncbi:MAG: hypothetical protein HY751_03780 [Nitrospinae bacterium]|nr:hypothetical protein [Nitrospinota bacterium]
MRVLNNILRVLRENGQLWVILLIPALVISAAAAGHIYYERHRPKNEVIVIDEGADEGLSARNGLVEQLRKAPFNELLTVYNAEMSILRDTYTYFNLLPTLNDVRREMDELYGSEDENALREFVIGGYFFSREEYRQAARHYKQAAKTLETPSTYLMLGLALRTVGEEVDSYYSYVRLMELGAKLKSKSVMTRAEQLLDRSVGKTQAMLIVSMIIGAIISTGIVIVMYITYRRITNKEKRGGMVIPYSQRHFFTIKIREADETALDFIEEEIESVRLKVVDSLNGLPQAEKRCSLLAPVRRLSDVRRELAVARANGLNGINQTLLEREFLLGGFNFALEDHSAALRHYNTAIGLLNLPSFHIMLALALMACRRYDAASRALGRASAAAANLNLLEDVEPDTKAVMELIPVNGGRNVFWKMDTGTE